MANLKYRIAAIVALVLLSLFALFPRNVTERISRNGVFVDTAVRHVPLKRGLDLEGGMYLALEIDTSKADIRNADRVDLLERALTTVRNRVDEFGVAEPNIQRAGDDRIIVELPGVQNRERAQSIVEKSAFLEFKITDRTQALEKVLPRMDAIIKDRGIASTSAPAAAPSANNPLAAGLFGADSGRDSTQKADSAKKQTDSTLLGSTTGALSSKIRPGSMPGEYYVATSDRDAVRTYLANPEVTAALPPGKEILWGTDSVPLSPTAWFNTLYVVDNPAIIGGDKIVDAQPAQTPMEGTLVRFTLNATGGRIFRGQTQKHIGHNMAIILDGRVIGTPPVIQSAISTEGQITMGGKPLQAATDLALVLRAGALPVPLKVVETREIGASLGRDSIDKGMQAGAIAVVLVVLIMLVYYRFAGVLAVGGLILYVLFTLAILAGFGAVLTLPGLAGFVLSIGIAVDANVLIFERIREELDHGKTVRTAIDEGFRHAMSAIIDSNVSTVLTAAVLYQYGTGPVRGFAVTLIAGIAASMVSAIFVVRTFFLLWLQRSRGAQTLSI